MYEYNAVIERIIDGDTVEALVDLGFHTFTRRKVRLYGIDAYESRTRDLEEKEKGLAAKARLQEMIYPPTGDPLGKVILISHGLDKYGRSLGTLIVDGVDLNQKLIEEGHAVPYLP